MNWILILVLPAVITAGPVRQDTYNGLPVMAYAGSFDTESDCNAAGLRNQLNSPEARPMNPGGAFYMCTRGFKVKK